MTLSGSSSTVAATLWQVEPLPLDHILAFIRHHSGSELNLHPPKSLLHWKDLGLSSVTRHLVPDDAHQCKTDLLDAIVKIIWAFSHHTMSKRNPAEGSAVAEKTLVVTRYCGSLRKMRSSVHSWQPSRRCGLPSTFLSRHCGSDLIFPTAAHQLDP